MFWVWTLLGQIKILPGLLPLSPQVITGRREADNAISREYGNRKASTHTPSGNRFGELAKIIWHQLTENGFSWASEYKKNPAFIEVYTHVAIIELFGYEERFQYKVQKKAKYWPGDSPEILGEDLSN